MCLLPLKRIVFYRKEERWYADIPPHDEADNEMIEGSDDILELLCNNFSKQAGRLAIEVSIRRRILSPIVKIRLKKVDEDDEGATYRVMSGSFVRPLGLEGEECWICNIAKDVFGKFPEWINIIHIF